MSDTFYVEANNAYRFHQLADLVDAFPKLNDPLIQIHADGDSLSFFIWTADQDVHDEKVAEIREALRSWGIEVSETAVHRPNLVSEDEATANGFTDFTIFVGTR